MAGHMRQRALALPTAVLCLLALPVCYSGLGLRGEERLGARPVAWPPASHPPLPALFFAPSAPPLLAPASHLMSLSSARNCGPRLGKTSMFGAQLRAGLGEVAGGRRQRRGGQVTCQLGDMDGFEEEFWDQDEVEDFLNKKLVLLRDEQVDRVIQCIVDRELEVDGKLYATLMPVDTPVIIAAFKELNGTQQLVPILEDQEIDSLFPTASAVLAEMDLALARSAVVLTVEGGEMDSDDFEDSDEESEEEGEGLVLMGRDEVIDPEDAEDSEDSEGPEHMTLQLLPGHSDTRTLTVGLRREELVDPEDSESEEVFPGRGFGDDSEDELEDQKGSEKIQVLATFYHDGDKYVVGAPLEPVLIIGSPVETEPEEARKEVTVGENIALFGLGINPQDMAALEDSSADYLLPAKEELERVTPQIEQRLESLWDEEEKEKEGLVKLRQKLIDQWRSNT